MKLKIIMEKKGKHGIPTTFRIPAELKEKLIIEANKKGLNLSQYLENLLLEPLENILKQQELIDQLKGENLHLKNHFKMLQQEVSFLNERRKRVVHILIKNEMILKEAFEEYKSEKFDRNYLVNKGFNFYFATHKAVEMDYIYTGVFDYCYVNFTGNRVRVVKERSYATN